MAMRKSTQKATYRDGARNRMSESKRLLMWKRYSSWIARTASRANKVK